MKKILTLLLLFPFSLWSVAQSYDQLWDKAAKAATKDLPQTALQWVMQVQTKAVAEGQQAQLLKSSLAAMACGVEISPDSVMPHIHRMEEALAREKRPLEISLWHGALAQVYAAYDQELRSKGIPASVRNERCRTHFQKSLEHPELLVKISYRDFLPLFSPGPQSTYFNDDLLHVFYKAFEKSSRFTNDEKIGLLEKIIPLYREQGNRQATLLLTLELLKKQNARCRVKGYLENHPYYQSLARLAQENSEQSSNIQTYVNLAEMQNFYDTKAPFAAHNDSLLVDWAEMGAEDRLYKKHKEHRIYLDNFIRKNLSPQVEFGPLPEVFYPGSENRIKLETRNLEQLQLRVTPIFGNSIDHDKSDDKARAKLARKKRKQSQVYTYNLPAAPCQWHVRQIDFTAPSLPGIYYAELVVDKKTIAHEIFHVSAIRPLVFSTATDSQRVMVVDSQTGRPVQDVSLTVCQTDGRQQVKVYRSADGIFQVKSQGRSDEDHTYYVSTWKDHGACSFTLPYHRSYYRPASSRSLVTVDLFTDRAIYRPGQEVGFSGVAYTRDHDAIQTVPALETLIRLYNVNHKVVDSLTVRTDEMGTFCGKFQLPKNCLSGFFTLEMQRGAHRCYPHRFRVEEYKRPTYTVHTEPIQQIYHLNDTVYVDGKARTYTDLPVAHSVVKYKVTRTAWFPETEGFKPQHGEVRTDAQGAFTFPVVLTTTAADSAAGRFNRFFYHIDYTVTAENGESVPGSLVVHAATRSACFELQVPDRICREHLPLFKVDLNNAANENVPTPSTYVLRDSVKEVHRGLFTTGNPFRLEALSDLPSGKYELEVFTNDKTERDTARFVLMSESDTKVVDRTKPFFAYDHSNLAKDTTFVLIGTPEEEMLLYYDLVVDGKIIESRRYELNDTVLRFKLAYRPEYGQGATACFAMVHDGKLHTFDAHVNQPLPDKRLQISWSSFRSRLQPGQQEEWRLHITYPDGTPAKANLMARLYDASLDVFGKQPWNFSNVSYRRHLIGGRWIWQDLDNGWKNPLLGYAVVGFPHLPVPVFTQWLQGLFNYRYTDRSVSTYYNYSGSYSRTDGIVRTFKMQRMDARVSKAAPDGAPTVQMENASAAENERGEQSEIRSNFAETAFFRPNLRTDAKGEVSIAFTLPESMTQWNFNALAHDSKMNYGSLDTTLIARKEFMVQPALPRFVRLGDRTLLPVKVINLSKSRLSAVLEFELEDGLRNHTILKQAKVSFTLAPGESRMYYFSYLVNDDTPLLIFRTRAKGAGFSDGEEHFLPVLSNFVEVTRTLPFTLREKGTYQFQVDTLFKAEKPLHRVLGVELSSNPAWYAVSALPVLADSRNNLSATEWATSFYALSLGAHIGKCNPALRQLVMEHADEIKELAQLNLDKIDDSTPWLSSGENESRRMAALYRLFDDEAYSFFKYTALDKLKDLQRADGSWSWYPGMKGNEDITVDVAILLARVQRLADDYSATLMLRKAYAYLRNRVALQVEKMKENEKKHGIHLKPTDFQLRYLYLMSLLGDKPDGAATYLLDRAAGLTKELTMYGKAVSAVVLAEFGREEAARDNLQSLLEHTVSRPDMGRYFDTSRAKSSFTSYRIPTQCAAIEALSYFGDEKAASEMRLWLLQAKRTQVWETSRASTDAVYALLSGAGKGYSTTALADSVPLTYALVTEKDTLANGNGEQTKTPHSVGYYKQRYTEQPAVDATTLSIDKQTEGLAWGSVYATFTLPVYEVSTEGKELKMTRYFELEKETGWKRVEPGTVLKTGDRIRQVFTITADRDFDFVNVRVSRPACFEPVRPLSGYRFNSDFAAYCAVKDVETDYFIEHLNKGTSVLQEEYFIDRFGQYSTGISKIACVYAPEFSGTVGDLSLTVEYAH